MENKVCLDITLSENFTISQGIYFPLTIILSDARLENWYYMNYMLPICRFDGINSLSCIMVDSYEYGSQASINGKIMRYSNIDIEFCKQIQDITKILCSEINKECYCILFLDFYHLKNASSRYHQIHYLHEVMFYGYNEEKQLFYCLGYLNKPFELFELSYIEVNNAFLDAVKYIHQLDGWESHMCMTLQLVQHPRKYPYDNKVFLGKLKKYINNNISAQCSYEQFLYLNINNETKIGLGIEVSNILLEYILCIGKEFENDKIISPKFTAFILYRDFHRALSERMDYFVKQNGEKEEGQRLVTKYYNEIVIKCEDIFRLYVKLCFLIEKKNKMKINHVITTIAEALQIVAEKERVLLTQFIQYYDVDRY